MSVGVINALGLIGASQAVSDSYGQKTAGYAQLLSLNAESPIPYNVPDAWAIPPRSQGRATPDELRRVFDDLTNGLSRETVLMARGSSLEETPGESPTLFLRHDPRDPVSSFRVFEAGVREVLGKHEDMGVLATVMVGGMSLFADGSRGIGWGNVSFVADTHHPMAPRDMHIAAVTGLGTRAVRAGSDAIFITADRTHGLINSFVNKTQEAFMTPFIGSRPCLQRRDYRQQEADYFDLERERILSRRLGNSFFNDFRFDPDTGEARTDLPRVFWGHLVRRRADLALSKINELRTIPGFKPQEVDIGANPFEEGPPLMNLIGILRYLARERGPVQVEGAFPHGKAVVPSLFQMQPMPETNVSILPLGVGRRDVYSHEVIGVADFRGPFLYTRGTTVDALREMDRRFAETGYILLMIGHEGLAIEATPNCRMRLAMDHLNVGSHAVSLARLKMRESPDAGYLLAQSVRLTNAWEGSIGGKASDEDVGGIQVYHRAHLQSNGSEMAVDLMPPEGLRTDPDIKYK